MDLYWHRKTVIYISNYFNVSKKIQVFNVRTSLMFSATSTHMLWSESLVTIT